MELNFPAVGLAGFDLAFATIKSSEAKKKWLESIKSDALMQ